MDTAFNSGMELYNLLMILWDEQWWMEGSGSLSIPSALSQIRTSVDLLIQVRTRSQKDLQIGKCGFQFGGGLKYKPILHVQM